MSINYLKYTNALLFFIKNCNNIYLGKTKLNKLFYYLDFIYFRDHKMSITGDKYLCKDFGPVPEKIDQVIADAKKNNLIKVEQVNNETRKFKFFITQYHDTDLSVFNQDEQDLLRNICKEFKAYTTKRIVDQTHFEAPWFYAEPYDEIDYNYSNDIEFFAK